MSLPDLSFLLRRAEEGSASARARAGDPSPDQIERRRDPGRPSGTVAALIAELRASRAALEEQNKVLSYSQTMAEGASERFEALFFSVPLALMVLDEHDMVVQANPMAQRSFQPRASDPPLTSLMPFVSADDAARVRAAFDTARAQGAAEVTEVLLCIGEQGRITGDLHIARIEEAADVVYYIGEQQGRITGDLHVEESRQPLVQFLCAVIDQGPLLAERQALQRSARELQERNAQLGASERRLEAIINSALDAIICVDQRQRITVFNPMAATLFQCSAQEALGSPLERFLPSAKQVLSFARIATQAGLGELTAITASGKELAVEINVSFERRAEGETTTVFARDLTMRKRAEARRNELEAQLRESHKMQAMGTLAGGIAHDFNNILHAILGNVELARASCAPGSPVLDNLLEISKAGARARDLVRQILTFSRNAPPQLCAVSLADVARDASQLLRVTMPPNIELTLELPPALPSVLADATQVEQALVNLCTNAIHAIGQRRGHIRLEAAALQPGARLRERLGLSASRYVALSVRDDGSGMDAATLSRVFEPFFTTKPVGQGTGLGLAVVHGVMRTHNGGIDVQSSPGHGSRFTLYFPVARGIPAPAALAAPAAPVAAPPPVARQPAPRQGRQRHVMYVDDDEALVLLVQRLLRRGGYEVSGFTDPREAIEALRAAPARYDLLVTDYNMPGYSGIDLLRAALVIRADLPVALASGYVTAEIEQAARAEGARALIHKPDDAQAFCATVDSLVRDR